jgi:aryl-alcohol dehydrogenase-like predicted oxidoreductase
MQALQKAFDLGVNFYDTALGYGNGHSEQLIGRVFKERRSDIVISSKVPPKNGRWPAKDTDPLSTTFPASWIIECTEKSLRNLGTDYIDLQQLHAWANAYMQETEWLEALQKLKQQGKIRAFGVSANDWEPYNTVNLVNSGWIDSVQVIYNIFEQRPEEKLFPAALENEVGILARVPFEEGLLTGSFPPGHQFAPGDWRAKWLTPDRLEAAQGRVEALKQFLSPDRPTLAALALKFCLSHPAVSTVIPGMRRMKNVEENASVSDGILLSEVERAQMKQHAFTHGWFYPWNA